MKLLSFLFVCAAAIQTASATTVALGGGLGGYQFGYTSTTGFNALTAANSTIQVGAITVGGFQQFAAADVSSPAFGTGMLAGIWLGDAVDDYTSDSFSGLQIWFKVETIVDGQTYTAYLADNGTLFPVNDGGIGDTIIVDSDQLDTISNLSSGNWSIDPINHQIVLNAVPEPSVALLGAIGTLALLRRRRASV